MRQAERQPTRFLRHLMVELFSKDELRCSTVRGKKGSMLYYEVATVCIPNMSTPT